MSGTEIAATGTTATIRTGRPATPRPGPDPLHDPDPRRAAEHAHLEALLRCWTAETGHPVTPGPLRVALTTSGLVLATEVRHCSPTGWHRFDPVRLERHDGSVVAAPLDPSLAVALVAAETGTPADAGADLTERTAESVRRVETFLGQHRVRPTSRPVADGFLDAEQALLLGHLHHPAPKSRDGISAHDLAAWSPELRGAFRLHWFAADASVVSHDAAHGATSLRGHDAVTMMAELAGRRLADGRVLVPAHPWQARDVLARPRVADLVASGRLEPLGELGPVWWPTSSVRTVYRPDVPVMLKLSLGLRLTNSRRESTRTELRRGVEVHRLLDVGYGAGTRQAHPDFTITRDPAWLAVDDPGASGGPVLTGLDVAVRDVPADVAGLRCLAGLVAPRPDGRDGATRSRLGDLVAGRDAGRWVADYTDRVLVPMLHLYAETGIGLEAHQQNTLVRLDADGHVAGASYRDNQGYYLATSRVPAVLGLLDAPATTLAVAGDAVVDERLSYYLLRNQAFAVIGCLGVDGLADERDLLAVLAGRLRAALPALDAAGPGGARLARRWLSADTLPAKANLLTRLHGIDEVVAPVDAQSVYVSAPNPLREVTR